MTDATRIYRDLIIAGDDAAELLESIHKEFGTRFEGFVFQKYFPSETEALPLRLGKLLGLESRKHALTLGHLVAVIQKGSWFEP